MFIKSFYFGVYLFSVYLVFSKPLSDGLINATLDRLELALDYLARHNDYINIDCLFGLVFAEAFLQDSLHSTACPARIKGLLEKAKTVYMKTIPLIKTEKTWKLFASEVVTLQLWLKKLNYSDKQFGMIYPQKSTVSNLFSKNINNKYRKNLSNECITKIVNNTTPLKTATVCNLNSECREFIKNVDDGNGYVLTHKLLLSQVARARACKTNKTTLKNIIKKNCQNIYTELISAEHFVGLGRIFDLFLEQTVLCGYEGFSDFLKPKWLANVLDAQRPSGCFPAEINRKTKREINQWSDGCADHTTGLGTAVLSLYVNYLIKTEINFIFIYQRK